ncbi:hypothetical protein LJR251_002763 [Rhizobium rhizogenes]|uniref:hypothetical protein n=1 Tax=Rhizobium rhizogenes TaxID=359 RepID=UPI003ECF4EA1
MEPTTIAAVISAVSDYIAKRNLNSWQQSVSDKLDDIFNNTVAILNELRSLRVDLPEIIDAAFQRDHLLEYFAEFKSEARVIGNIISAFPDIENKFPTKNDTTNNEISDIYRYCHKNVGVCIDRCGYSSYFSVTTGASLCLIVGHWAKIPKHELNDFYIYVANYLLDCLDPTKGGSIAWAADQLNNARNAKIAEGAVYARKGGLGINPNKKEPRPPIDHSVKINPFTPSILDIPTKLHTLAVDFQPFVWVEISGGVQSNFTHGEFFGSADQIYENFPENRGVTYGGEYGLEQRMGFVMRATSDIQKEFRDIDTNWARAVSHQTACRLCASSLQEIASKVCL